MKAMVALSIVASSLISALVTLVAAGVVSSHSAAAQAPPTLVTAQGFVLQDADGKTRAELGFQTDGSAGLILFDRSGAQRLRTVLDGSDDPSVTLHDVDFTRRVALAANPQAGAVVLVRDPGVGTEGFLPVRVRLAVRNNGEAHIGLFEPPGETPVWITP